MFVNPIVWLVHGWVVVADPPGLLPQSGRRGAGKRAADGRWRGRLMKNIRELAWI